MLTRLRNLAGPEFGQALATAFVEEEVGSGDVTAAWMAEGSAVGLWVGVALHLDWFYYWVNCINYVWVTVKEYTLFKCSLK